MAMRRTPVITGLLVACLLACFAGLRADDSPPHAEAVESVTGRVSLHEGNSKASLRDASKVVVWLVPAEGTRNVALVDSNVTYRMAQHNKKFVPDFLVVPVGAQVEFPNLDPWFHSVFSLYQGKRFDLGLYEAGSRKKVEFDRPGPSYIFCNIHPEMSAVVLAVESDYWAISGKDGRVAIPNVPDGKYVLHVWYANADEKELNSLERPVEINSASQGLPPISIAATPQHAAQHKNKYGHDYDPDVLEPVY